MHPRGNGLGDPWVIASDDGVRLDAGPVRVALKVTSEHSDRFTVVDYEAPPRFAGPAVLHHHTREDWAAYVLAGRLTFIFAEREVQAPAGTTVFVPAGADFAWRNDEDGPARFLAVHAPAGFDRFFLDVADDLTDRGGTVSPEVMGEIIPPLWQQYGIEPIRSPAGPRLPGQVTSRNPP